MVMGWLLGRGASAGREGESVVSLAFGGVARGVAAARRLPTRAKLENRLKKRCQLWFDALDYPLSARGRDWKGTPLRGVFRAGVVQV